MQSKHDKNSPEGAAMRDVIELRVEAIGGWQNLPYALTLCVIVKPGVVPSSPTTSDLLVQVISPNGSEPTKGTFGKPLARSQTGLPQNGRGRLRRHRFTGFGSRSPKHGPTDARPMLAGIHPRTRPGS